MLPEKVNEPISHAGKLAQMRGIDSKVSTSIDITTPAGRKVMIRAFDQADGRLSEMINMDIEIVNYVAHSVQITSRQTGEVVDGVRLVLYGKDDETYETTGNTFIDSLSRLIFAYGEPPWNPPLRLKIKSRKVGERSIYWFEPLS